MKTSRTALAILTVFLLVGSVTAPQPDQSHNLSEIHPIDVNLNMSDRSIFNVSEFKVRDGLQLNGLTVEDDGDIDILRWDTNNNEWDLPSSNVDALNLNGNSILGVGSLNGCGPNQYLSGDGNCEDDATGGSQTLDEVNGSASASTYTQHVIDISGTSDDAVIKDYYESNTDSQDLSSNNGSTPAGASTVNQGIQITGGSNTALKDYYVPQDENENVEDQLLNTSDGYGDGNDDKITISDGNGNNLGTVMIDDDSSTTTLSEDEVEQSIFDTGDNDQGNLGLNGNEIVDTTGSITLGGGNVEIPNGDLLIKGKENYDSSGDNAVVTLGDANHNIISEYGFGTKFNDTNERWVFQDEVSGTDYLDISSSSVEIPNGNLDMKTNNIVGVSAIQSDSSVTVDIDNNNDQSKTNFRVEADGSTEIFDVIGNGNVEIPNGNLDMNGNRIESVADPNSGDDAMDRDYADSRYRQESDIYWGVVSLETGDWKMWDGNSGTTTVPGSDGVNCNGDVCIQRDGSSNRFAIEFEMPDLPNDEQDFPGGLACHGFSAGDNEQDEEAWASGVRSVDTDSNGHCEGTTEDCATAYVWSDTNSHDTYGVKCEALN